MNAEIKALNQNPIPLSGCIITALEEMVEEESMINTDTKKLLTKQDTTELVDFIMETLKNHSIKKAGKNNFSFSPYLMGLTMNQYLQGPTAYERFRDDALFVCPSPGNLKLKKQQQRVGEGDCVELY